VVRQSLAAQGPQASVGGKKPPRRPVTMSVAMTVATFGDEVWACDRRFRLVVLSSIFIKNFKYIALETAQRLDVQDPL
jgi:hypothetical protein